MSAQPQRNRPDVEFFSAPVPAKQPDREETRFLFSPFLDYPCSPPLDGIAWIRRGVFRPVKHVDQPCRGFSAIRDAFNVSVLQSYNVGDETFPRDAGVVADGLIRTHQMTGNRIRTGLVILTALQGLDEKRDYEAIDLVQEILWPVNCESAAEHKSFLLTVDFGFIEATYGEDLARRVHLCQQQILNEAIPNSEAYCRAVREDASLALRASVGNLPGHRDLTSHELMCCRWIGEAAPVRPVTQMEGVNTAQDLMAMLLHQQAENQQMMQMMVNQAMNAEKPEAPDAQAALLTTLTQMMQTQNALIEKIGVGAPIFDTADVEAAPGESAETTEFVQVTGGESVPETKIERRQRESRERNQIK
jgi:hypothetical protein